jgi:hypothetical protein
MIYDYFRDNSVCDSHEVGNEIVKVYPQVIHDIQLYQRFGFDDFNRLNDPKLFVLSMGNNKEEFVQNNPEVYDVDGQRRPEAESSAEKILKVQRAYRPIMQRIYEISYAMYHRNISLFRDAVHANQPMDVDQFQTSYVISKTKHQIFFRSNANSLFVCVCVCVCVCAICVLSSLPRSIANCLRNR